MSLNDEKADLPELTNSFGLIAVQGDRLIVRTRSGPNALVYEFPSWPTGDPNSPFESKAPIKEFGGGNIEDSEIWLTRASYSVRYCVFRQAQHDAILKCNEGQRVASVPWSDIAKRTLTPLAVGEVILRACSTGEWWQGTRVIVDPEGSVPSRIRAGAIVIKRGKVLLIERTRDSRHWFEIPGGGSHVGEAPEMAVVRELREETGLDGRVLSEAATVLKEGRREHYFRMDARGSIGAEEHLDLRRGSRLVWVSLASLPNLPVWPKRLAWRVSMWAEIGWPSVPMQLTDAVPDSSLAMPCNW